MRAAPLQSLFPAVMLTLAPSSLFAVAWTSVTMLGEVPFAEVPVRVLGPSCW